MNLDLLNNANSGEVARGTMSLVDRIQNLPAHVQMHAAAALFLAICNRWGVEPQDAFTATKNLINDVDGKRAEFEAVDSYLENEL